MSAPRHHLRLVSAIATLPLAAVLAIAPAATAVAGSSATPLSVLAVTGTRLPVSAHLTAAQAKAVRAAATRKAHGAVAHRAISHRASHRATHRRARHLKLARHQAAATTVPAAAASTAATAPAAAPVVLTPFEARMVFLVNDARAQNGLAALTVTAGTTDVARHWAVQLAGDDALSHNPDLVDDLQAAGSADWTFLAENVGTGPIGDADGLFTAYMNSPHHRANILDPRATSIGMGAVAAPESDGDAEWNVMDFVNSYDTTYGPAHTNPVSDEEPVPQLTADIGG